MKSKPSDSRNEHGEDHTLSDTQLLKLYAETGSHRAFHDIVKRHVALVYSVCLRRLRHAHMAEEATIQTFAVLHKKARSLTRWRFLRRPSIPLFLHRTAVEVTQAALQEELSEAGNKELNGMSMALAQR